MGPPGRLFFDRAERFEFGIVLVAMLAVVTRYQHLEMLQLSLFLCRVVLVKLMRVLIGRMLIAALLTNSVSYIAIVDDLVGILSLITGSCQSVDLLLKKMLQLAALLR